MTVSGKIRERISVNYENPINFQKLKSTYSQNLFQKAQKISNTEIHTRVCPLSMIEDKRS